MRSIIRASDKLIHIIGMGFGDAEIAQGCPILRLHDPHDIVLLERELEADFLVSPPPPQKKKSNVSEHEDFFGSTNTNLSRVIVSVDMPLPVLLRDFVFVFLYIEMQLSSGCDSLDFRVSQAGLTG